ncbi:MAG TPA: stage V sporulation protein E [Pseudogracilibacillus sp.]|nr:stage V sporulation protein E [Pseudogracilibacillus sp.]
MEKKSLKSFYKFDFTLLFIVILLLLIGLMFVYSSSYAWAEYKYDDAFFYVKRQLLFVSLGIVGMVCIAFIPYYVWRSYVYYIFAFCLLLTIAVLIPNIGIVRGGAQSWIGIGAFSIQPSEFIKLGLIFLLSHLLTKNRRTIKTFFKGFFTPIVIIFFVFGLIMLQPDFGTGVVLVCTSVLLVFIAGARIIYFVYLAMIGAVGFTFLIISAPYRISRIHSFLNPWNDPLGDGFQIIQSLYAVGPGKLFGVGFTNSIQKYFYLPEPQTDFIFAIISEEFGFVGGAFVLVLFSLLAYRGTLIALNIPDLFGRFAAFGIVAMITIQAFINISVVIGLIPVTGITLPFLSYGGSSLTLTLCSVGVLLNISSYAKY